MAEERATNVAVQHADGSSALTRASTHRDVGVALARRACSASDPGPTRGVQHQVSGLSETRWTPLVESLVRSLREPGGADLLPAALIVLGLALAAWVGATAFAGAGRRSGR